MELIRNEKNPDTSSELIQFIQKSAQIEKLVRLPGDASTRQYYRVTVKKVEGKADESNHQESTSQNQFPRHLIVMVMESFTEQGDSNPFISIQKHLESAGVDVPRILDFSPEQGYLLLEDLGDITLLRTLQDVGTLDIERYQFERAIDALVEMHSKTGPDFCTEHEKKVIKGFQQRFDVEKLMWEVNFTLEHFYQKHLNRTISESDHKVIQDGFLEICTALADEPTVFTHRDYHSRNIMILESAASEQSRFVMIDFQDARMGPPQYDLASLLRDSYYQLEESQVAYLVRYYYDQMNARGANLGDFNHFKKMFDWMAVQRNFKAIGSFASFLNRRGNPGYLKFIGNTFENIRRNLFQYPEFSRLREVLYHYYYF